MVIEIDGSEGEGGGQILRTSLTLSLLTQKAFRISRIRARRKNPGLAAQHLKAIEAAASISGSRVEGATVGSREIYFEPGQVVRGNYHFDIGTAGAATLVFQTICFPLARLAPGSTLLVTGGTHVPQSPSYHYLEYEWLPWMKRFGYEFHLEMKRAGYYPRGGGEIEAAIGVHHKTTPALTVAERGELNEIMVLSTYSMLPRHVAERQLRSASEALHSRGLEFTGRLEELPSLSPGSQLLIHAGYEQGSCTFFALGERGRPAEKVGSQAARQFLDYHAGTGAVNQYLADQLLIPAVLQNKFCRYSCSKVTEHLLTNRTIISRFHSATIQIQGERGMPGTVEISTRIGAD